MCCDWQAPNPAFLAEWKPTPAPSSRRCWCVTQICIEPWNDTPALRKLVDESFFGVNDPEFIKTEPCFSAQRPETWPVCNETCWRGGIWKLMSGAPVSTMKLWQVYDDRTNAGQTSQNSLESASARRSGFVVGFARIIIRPGGAF